MMCLPLLVGWAAIIALFSTNSHHLLTLGTFMFLAGLSCVLSEVSADGEPSRRESLSQPLDAARRVA